MRLFTSQDRCHPLRLIRRLAFGVCASASLTQAAWAQSDQADAAPPVPERVVSINLCTDQLAMLLARPGRLLSVSDLAADPDSSVLHAEADAYPANHARAEEIFLMQPDLVLAGTFSSHATVNLLKRLGFRVETFQPAYSFDDIRSTLRRMGRVLGRQALADTLLSRFEARLKAVATAQDDRPRAMVHASNNYTSGANTLVHDVLTAAGLRNVGAERGYRGTTSMPLEVMVMAQPDLIITGTSYDKPALAQEDFDHPALAAYRRVHRTRVGDKYWVCGAPFTVRAVEMLAAVRAQLARTGESS